MYLQTGWGTRAGIGDASAATAAMDNMGTPNEKAAPSYNPSQQPQPYYSQPPNSNNISLSPFSDRNEVPAYSQRGQSPYQQGGDDMQMGYAK